jgi:hypothetical protein
MLSLMNPVAELRAAVAALPHVPDTTPVEPTLAFGAPNALVNQHQIVGSDQLP